MSMFSIFKKNYTEVECYCTTVIDWTGIPRSSKIKRNSRIVKRDHSTCDRIIQLDLWANELVASKVDCKTQWNHEYDQVEVI